MLLGHEVDAFLFGNGQDLLVERLMVVDELLAQLADRLRAALLLSEGAGLNVGLVARVEYRQDGSCARVGGSRRLILCGGHGAESSNPDDESAYGKAA